MEGFNATGQSQDAQKLGEIEANDFYEACEKLVGKDLDKKADGSFRYDYPSIWACQLFDNEADARKNFG